MDSQLPMKYEMLGRILDGQSPQMREVIQYAIALLAVEDGHAEIIDRPVIDAREYHTFRTNMGEVFTLAKPAVSETELERIRTMVREISQGDSKDSEI